MDVCVMLEQVERDGYRATTFAPAPLVAEAATRDEAIGKLLAVLHNHLHLTAKGHLGSRVTSRLRTRRCISGYPIEDRRCW
jgi:hypothetical protein